MNKAEMIQHLNTWMKVHDDLELRWDDMGVAFGTALVDMPLWDASWRMFEAYTATLSDLLGDTPGRDSWLGWFCSENDMGRKKFPAGYDGNMAPVETTEDLADLIIECRERT